MRKNTITIIAIFLGLSATIAAAFLYINRPKIINNYFEFEYGEPVDIYSLKIVDTDNYYLSSTNCVNKEGYDYPNIGEYGITHNYKYLVRNYVASAIIKVVDTVSPEFYELPKELVFGKGSKNIDYSSYFKAKDLDEVTYSFDDSNVNYDQIGEYEVIVTASDTSNNETSITTKVIITKDANVDINITYIEGLIIANKKHPLPKDYNPGEDPLAASKIKELIKDAQKENLKISSDYSGFRSYSTQNSIYLGYVSKDGQKNADRYSARPGYSEHQTGFAFDLRSPNGKLLETEKEIKWVHDNCYKYGFIIRYLEDKEEITGYMYEPWHLRYVGDKAEDIAASGLTLEEYYGFEGGTSY